MNEHDTTGTDDLVKFYGARLDEHEKAARDCPEPGKSALLREVAEGRELLAAYDEATDMLEKQAVEHSESGMPAIVEGEDGETGFAPERFYEVLLASLPAGRAWLVLGAEIARRAAIWHDHPDYNPDWAPDDSNAGS